MRKKGKQFFVDISLQRERGLVLIHLSLKRERRNIPGEGRGRSRKTRI